MRDETAWAGVDEEGDLWEVSTDGTLLLTFAWTLPLPTRPAGSVRRWIEHRRTASHS